MNYDQIEYLEELMQHYYYDQIEYLEALMQHYYYDQIEYLEELSDDELKYDAKKVLGE